MLDLLGISKVLDLVERSQQSRQLRTDSIEELGRNILTFLLLLLHGSMGVDSVGYRGTGCSLQTLGKFLGTQASLDAPIFGTPLSDFSIGT